MIKFNLSSKSVASKKLTYTPKGPEIPAKPANPKEPKTPVDINNKFDNNRFLFGSTGGNEQSRLDSGLNSSSSNINDATATDILAHTGNSNNNDAIQPQLKKGGVGNEQSRS